MLRYRLRASQDDERIENYPGITLAEARKPAGKLRLAIGHGGIRQHEPCYEKTRVTTIDTLRQLGADFKVKKQES
ncbi:hypothetical protein WJ972_02550 [Achromobacter insuavis]